MQCLKNYCETDNVKGGFIHNPNNFLKDNFYLQFDSKIEVISEERIRESRLFKYKLNMDLDDSAINDLKKHGYENVRGGRYTNSKTLHKTNNSSQFKNKSKSTVCYRCGRPGHTKPNCYASTHAKGYQLYY